MNDLRPEVIYRPSLNWDEWREGVAEATGEACLSSNTASPEAFGAGVRGSRYKSGFVATINSTPHRFIRTSQRIARDGMDAVFVQFYEHTHTCVTHMGQESVELRPGHLIIQDMAEPFVVDHGSYKLMTLALPRAALAPFLHGDRTYPTLCLPATGGSTNAVINMMQLLRGQLGYLTDEDVTPIIECIAKLVANQMNNGPRLLYTMDENSQTAARFLQAAEYISRTYANPRLNSTEVARHLNVSRTTLYRLFEPMGGFVAFLRYIRMKHAMRKLLRTGSDVVKVQQIAESCGFAHASSFTRSFKEHYGVSPRDILMDVTAGKDQNIRSSANTFSNWLATLNGARLN
ncbi:helix-turn-helix domain-containing protein [Pseudovibrio brasiliensis]|uniref:Helix-turn-helix domain-containing protein n=1 Tax=Pseudovibrio brasiliensis TaxID=1898042 RepID=A0ABX8AZG7_9HYPH|nr:helix-turn-helix domain-containing protein [Pseudovibrio brasiliensis]QUS58676.1 helix-turn-helix domain-containing protein [Pseudovibrio brasiliensis]